MNKVVHFDIPFHNKTRAMSFYGQTFGWTLQDMGAAMGDYVLAQTAKTDGNHMVEDKGAINGGLSKHNANTTAPRVYIAVDDIESAFKSLEAAGGRVVQEPMPIPNGRMALFSDTEGNVVGLVDGKKT